MVPLISSFIKDLIEEFAEIRFAAASLAFSTLISIIPFLLIVLAVFQTIGGVDKLYPQAESVILNYLKDATGGAISYVIRSTLENVRAKQIGVTGIILLVLATYGLIRNIDLAFHRIWKIKLRKTIFKRIWVYSLILILVPIGLALYIGFRSFENIQIISEGIRNNYFISIWVTGFLFFMYKIIPDAKVNLLPAGISAISSGALLSVVQGSFLWFAKLVFQKNKIYGSLISFPIFLFWLFIVWCIVLIGVSMCSYLQRRVFTI